MTAGRKLEVMDVSDPAPGPYECLVKIDACAICTGTDSNIISGNFPWLVDPPFNLGHESTGVIVELGDRVCDFEVGQRVTRPAGVLSGRRRDGVGSVWGGFAELGLIVDVETARKAGVDCRGLGTSSRRPLPQDVDPIWAALSVNQREILSVTQNIDLGPGSSVVVLGSGYNGLLFSLYFKHAGAERVLVIGSLARRALACETFLADEYLDYKNDHTTRNVRQILGGHPDVVIDAVGTLRSMEFARDMLGPRTAFGRYGMHEFDRIDRISKEIASRHSVLNLAADEVSATDRWYQLWRQGFFDRKGIYDGTVPLEQIGNAFERLARREAVKLVVTI